VTAYVLGRRLRSLPARRLVLLGLAATIATVGGLLAAARALEVERSGGVVAVPASAPPSGPDPLLVAVGDIACRPGLPRVPLRCHQAGTAMVAARLRPDAIALLGDTQYDRGTLREYAGSFHRTWGRLRAPMRPAVGNHEYLTPGASGYYGYFGRRAGPRGRGYYSYDLGSWHVIVLNSNCWAVPCGSGSAQERWLRRDLAAHPNRCVLAYWHHPRFSSGFHGNYVGAAPFWRALYRAGADVVLTGHDHDYERFAPQTPTGRRDPARGLRQFVVGTGGGILRTFPAVKPNSERRNNRTFGVLAMTLSPGGYSWRFVPEPGYSFSDAGSASCH
jgi:Calcineurin-like phosphoesterase